MDLDVLSMPRLIGPAARFAEAANPASHTGIIAAF
jgi:hypothetical protein